MKNKYMPQITQITQKIIHQFKLKLIEKLLKAV